MEREDIEEEKIRSLLQKLRKKKNIGTAVSVCLSWARERMSCMLAGFDALVLEKTGGGKRRDRKHFPRHYKFGLECADFKVLKLFGASSLLIFFSKYQKYNIFRAVGSIDKN